jgi:hypothetical protein
MSPASPTLAARWSDPATWPGGFLPDTGACVTIPAGKRVLLDLSPPPLAGLDVAGVLAFDDDADRELRADWIRVTGVLQIGTRSQPFAHHATITLATTSKAVCSMEAIDRTLAVEDDGAVAHPRPAARSELGAPRRPR